MKKTDITQAAAVRVMLKHSFFSEAYYSCNVYDASDTVPTLATDGASLMVNAQYWNMLSIDLKASAIVHEVIHIILHHCSRMAAHHNRQVANVAMDLVVNDLLVQNGFSLSPTWIQPLAQYRNWTWEAVYRDIMKNNPPKKGGGPGDGWPKEWEHAWADIQPFQGTKEEQEAFEAKVEQMVQKALETARAMGNSPAGIEEVLPKAYEQAKEPWYNFLHRFMQSLCTSDYNWRRINKRQIIMHNVFEPANVSEALGEIVVFTDCSGSVYDTASQLRFAAQVQAIFAECKPQKVWSVPFDAQVYEPREFGSNEEYEPVMKGGGGTHFEPLFDWVEEMGICPAVVIVLTDLYGSFPAEAPDYPVIWATIDNEDGEAPFGETLHVN